MTDRTTSILNLIEGVARSAQARDLLTLVMNGFASLYEADVRLYRRDVSAMFVLASSRRKAGAAEPAERFSDALIPSNTGVFRLSGVVELFDAPRRMETIFAGLGVGDVAEWLLLVSAEQDPTLESTLTLVCQVVNQRLAALERESLDHFRRRLHSVLCFGDPPFYALLRMALETVASETGGQSAQLTVYTRHGGAPKLAVHYRRPDAGPPETDAAHDSTVNSAMRTAIGRSLVMALDVRGASAEPLGRTERFTRAACGELRLWLSGVLTNRSDLTSLVEEEFAAQFVQRIRGSRDDAAPPVPIDGAVLVVLPDGSPRTPVAIEDMIEVLQHQLRTADLVGPIDGEGAWVLLPGASSDVSSAIMARLSRATRAQGSQAVRMGVAVFGPSQEAPEQLLQRALVNARAAPPM